MAYEWHDLKRMYIVQFLSLRLAKISGVYEDQSLRLSDSKRSQTNNLRLLNCGFIHISHFPICQCSFRGNCHAFIQRLYFKKIGSPVTPCECWRCGSFWHACSGLTDSKRTFRSACISSCPRGKEGGWWRHFCSWTPWNIAHIVFRTEPQDTNHLLRIGKIEWMKQRVKNCHLWWNHLFLTSTVQILSSAHSY